MPRGFHSLNTEGFLRYKGEKGTLGGDLVGCPGLVEVGCTGRGSLRGEEALNPAWHWATAGSVTGPWGGAVL